MLNASDVGNNHSDFNNLVEQLTAHRKDKILDYLTANKQELAMSVAVGSTDYHETIFSILQGLDLPTSDLVNTDGQVILVGGSNVKFTNNADLVIGLGNSNNTLSGGLGNDVLIGGLGADTLKGGTGNDTYIYKEGNGTDTIMDAMGFGGDGLGQILYTRADGSSKSLVGEILAGTGKGQASDGEFTYTFIGKQTSEGLPEGVGTLIITRAGTSDKITVEHYKNGDLGLNLHLAQIDRATYQGTAGTDDLTGPADQNKILLAGAGNDRVVNGPGDDQLYGEDGHDILIATGGNDELYGGTGNDAMTGGDDNDYLEGNAGDDLLNGDLGVDVLLGGDGNDWLLGGGNLMPGLTAQQLADSATAPWGVITDANGNTGLAAVSGTIVNANDDSNMLDGGAGNDWLIGAGNSDYADGGADNDTLVGMAGDDDLRGSGGNDLIYGDATQGDINIGGITQLYAASETHGNDYLDGGDGSDTLIGDGGADELFGGSGDDLLIGDNSNLDEQYHGADYLDGEDGNDTLYGYGKDDELFGGAGDDILEGDSNTIAQSLHGNDYLDGEDGNDKLQGDGGSDQLFGGDGNDQLFGDADDIATEYQGDDYLDGEAGDDYLRGYAGNDTLIGGDGNDGLLAEAGDDILIGGTGADQLQGGAGDDSYYLNLGDGQDTLLDASGSNTIIFGDGITADSLSIIYDTTGTLQLSYGPDIGNGVDSVSLVNGFAGNVIQTYRFADGSELTHAQLMELVLPALNYTGTSGDDNVSGSGHDDVMSGGAGHDTIRSQGGDDMLDGGAGDDTLIGGTGHDTYQLNWNGGNDTVIEAAGEISNILIDSAFTVDNLTATRQGDDLAIALGSGTSRLTLQNYFLQPSQTWTITDASGNTISAADALAATESANQNNADVIQRLWDNYARERQSEGIHSYLSAGYQTTATYGVLTQTDRTATMNYISRSGNINHADGSTSFNDSIQYTGLGDGTIEDRTATIALQTTNLAGGISTSIYGGGYSGGQVNQVLASINWGAKTATGHSTYTVIENSNGNPIYSYLDQENGYVNGTVSGYSSYSGVTPTYNNLPGQVVLNHLSVQEGVSISQVYGDDAEQYIEGNGLIDGGGGNDVLNGSYDALLYGNTGDDQLYNAAMMIGGAGNDTIIGGDGNNTAFYTRTGNGVDIVNDIEFIDEDTLTASERNFYDWYYQQTGIPLPPVSINANDYAALKSYYLSTNSSNDTIEFASGVSLSDLTLSWTAVDSQVALQISWNGDSTIKTLIPRSGDRIGTGIEQFRFSDGTVIYIGDMIAMAPPHPDFDATVAAFTHSGGGQLVDVIPETILADTGIDPATITVNRDGDDLLLTTPSGEDSLRIANWYADPNAMPATTIQFANGIVLDAATLTAMGQSNLIGGNHIDRQGSQSADNMDGSNGIANIMYGNAGGDYLSGGDMNDTLYSGTGNDNLYGQDGSDLLLGKR